MFFDIDLLPNSVKLKEALSWTGRFSGELGQKLKGKLPSVGSTRGELVFQEGALQLLRYRPTTAQVQDLPVLIIPSLINRYYVLDLLPGKSLLEFLLSQGFPVYVIEWGSPEDEDRWLSLERMVDGRIRHAVQAMLDLENGEKFHLLGHCLGGTLGVMYGVLHPEEMASLTLLTAPVDFRECGQLSVWSRFSGFDVDAFVEAYGNVPWSIMQAAFHSLRPVAGVSKYVKMFSKISDEKFMRGFWALETWSADNVSFPGECYKALIKDLYRENGLVEGKISISGRPIRLSDISFPVLNIAGLGDHIVPPEATLDSDHMPARSRVHLTNWTVEGGHIGALLGKRAQLDIWPKLAEWLRSHGQVEESHELREEEARAI